MWKLIENYPIESLATFATILPIGTFIYRMAYQDRAIRFFFWYLVVKLIIEVPMFYMASRVIPNLFLSNLLTVTGFFFLAAAFFNLMESPARKNTVFSLAVVFVAVVIRDALISGVYTSFPYAGATSCAIVSCWCVLYFYELFVQLKVPFLYQYPPFLLSAGLLMYCFPCIPIFLLSNKLDAFPYNTDMEIFIQAPYVMESVYLAIFGFGILVQKKYI